MHFLKERDSYDMLSSSRKCCKHDHTNSRLYTAKARVGVIIFSIISYVGVHTSGDATEPSIVDGVQISLTCREASIYSEGTVAIAGRSFVSRV